MDQLHFRIVTSATCELTVNELKELVEQCDLDVLTMEAVELDGDYKCPVPSVLESAWDVIASCRISMYSNIQKSYMYKKLCELWCDVTRCVGINSPLLQLFHNDSFKKRGQPSHSATFASISLGVHPYIGLFSEYSFFKLSNDSFGNFLHDLSQFHIIFGEYFDENNFCTSCITDYADIPYRHIRNIICFITNYDFEMYLDLLHPPLFYLKSKTLFSRKNRVQIKRVNSSDIEINVLGKSNMIRLKFRGDDSEKWYDIISCMRNRCQKIPIHFVHMRQESKTVPLIPQIDMENFGCCYMLKAVIERNYVMCEQSQDISGDIFKIKGMCSRNPDIMEKVLCDILFLIDSGKFIHIWKAIDILCTHYQNINFKRHSIPTHCRLIRRITLTPTRMLLWPPDLMHENRILRHFNPDYFIRVIFRDDDFMTFNNKFCINDIYHNAIILPMNNGICIGPRHFELLAWSNSQLRDHGVSMYAKDSLGRTSADVRKWIEISPQTQMSIPKCLSRMGQCFSQTEESVQIALDNVRVKVEKDIERGIDPGTGKTYCFSDGIGKISATLAEKVRSSVHGNKCSAFQIRYGGCKGMLVVDPTLEDNDIVFRESMKKFHCEGQGHTTLEIAKKSKPIPLRLNRQIIAILHDLGVKPRVFLRMQEVMLQNLIDMLLYEDKASQYLNENTPFSIFQFKDLTRSGINLTEEPFFRNLLLGLHRYCIDIIKTKTNIDIDPNYARNMFGVLDETGILEYGQVFVQYSVNCAAGVTTPEESKILKGPVMVTKCPCVHPADIRKFQAVDVQELHHIVDCIVFPQRGPRPHPDEMAGSDLDGDEYGVFWMPELFFKGQNAIAPNYLKPQTDKFLNISDFLVKSETADVVEFLKEFIKNDQIGIIATAHMAQADKLRIDHDICINIAAKHAISVDFPKTGCTARLNFKESPIEFPDFLERYNRQSYKSKKSIGKMYRVSKDFESENQFARLEYRDVKLDPLLIMDGWQRFEESAIVSKNEFVRNLRTILMTYGIAHEAEAFCGTFIKLHNRFRARRDRADIITLVQLWLKDLFKKTREDFFSSFTDDGDISEITNDMRCKASAWYVVTYRDTKPEFLSFPWIMSNILSNIRILHFDSSPIDHLKVPLISKLESVIMKNYSEKILPQLSTAANYMLNQLNYHCDREVMERAVSVLTKWGEDEKIITMRQQEGKFLFYNTFLRLIIHVAELNGFVSTRQDPDSCYNATIKRKKTNEESFTSAFICLAFFSYCMKLRFLNKPEVSKVLPFKVYNDRILSKRSLVTYHSLAITHILPTLCNEEYMRQVKEPITMKPVSVNSSVFGQTPLEPSKLRYAEYVLINKTGVEEIVLREDTQRRKVIVSAEGCKASLSELQYILRKNERLMNLMGHFPIIFEY